ncbi:amino acid ABC transporter permease [Planosporangium thailandense]|uniref:Amino acid ABC transporter permease n=1 Tax=Planosporangium thailandense TaxID=765197 RepID=A0ABX0XX70_9ACTN|nr:amino acid ABC transporter permease [Planosporangium thailandense]NJC69882.1 amino acid ABC transporter permease [Planosporangium thailandense]
MTGIWQDFVTHQGQLIDGLIVSLQLAGLTLLFGLPGGLILAIAGTSRTRLTRYVAIALTEIGRGTPALVMLQLVYNGIPVTLSGLLSAGIALALTTAAYTSEIMRGGLQAVPEGEIEAASALGMSRWDTLRDVVIPQGLRIALPSLMSFSVIMFQATSLAFTIAVPELMSQAKSIANSNFHYFNLFIIAAVMYAAITISASAFTDRVERRLSRHV